LLAFSAAEEEGDRLSSDELVSTALLLLVAGFETTVNLIGNGVVALLGEHEPWQLLGDEPALVPAAVEELLRYESPVQATSRIATGDVEVGESAGARLPGGGTGACRLGRAGQQRFDPAECALEAGLQVRESAYVLADQRGLVSGFDREPGVDQVHL
jgi:hypothetical protein